MEKTLEIDFVSDVACPWCAVGLASFEQALAEVAPDVKVNLRFQPFELNPAMPPEGQDAAEHLSAKYGMNADQLIEGRERIRQRGAELGFEFGLVRKRVWNTFNAHRLLHWAGTISADHQLALKREILKSYHGQGENPGDVAVLTQAATRAGLDAALAQAMLTTDEFSAEVREAEKFWQQMGINSVPAVVINRKHLVSGGQPPEVFANALRQVASTA